MMVSYYIYDTGYDNTDNQGTQMEQANGGQPLRLWGAVTIKYDDRNNLDKQDVITNTGYGSPAYVSSERAEFEIHGILTKDNVQNFGASISDIVKLKEFKRTPSYKILFVGKDSGDNDAIYNEKKEWFMFYHIANGHVNTGSNFSEYEQTYPHVHFLINGVDLQEDASSNVVTYTIYGVLMD